MKKAKGMTLVELVVVIAVIALVAGVMVDQTVATIEAERTTATQDNLNSIANAIRNFYQDIGYYPSELRHLSLTPADFISKKLYTWYYTDVNGAHPKKDGYLSTYRGPYVTRKFNTGTDVEDETLYDKWGSKYSDPSTFDGNTCEIRSDGPDRIANNADDIIRIVLTKDIQNKVNDEVTKTELPILNAAVVAYFRQASIASPRTITALTSGTCHSLEENILKKLENLGYISSAGLYMDDGVCRYQWDSGKFKPTTP